MTQDITVSEMTVPDIAGAETGAVIESTTVSAFLLICCDVRSACRVPVTMIAFFSGADAGTADALGSVVWLMGLALGSSVWSCA